VAKLAEAVLREAGFVAIETNVRIARTGVTVPLVGRDAEGGRWLFDLGGPFQSRRGGLARSDVVWRALGRAAAVRAARGPDPLVLLTTQLPTRPGEGDTALRAAGTSTVHDVVDVLSEEGRDRLMRYAKGGSSADPLPGFWSARDLADRA